MRAFEIGTCITWIVILAACQFGYSYFLGKGEEIGLNIAGLIIASISNGLWIANLYKLLRKKPNH